MPAIIDDPSAPTIYRVSGEAPFPAPNSPLPANILPRQVTLRDRQTVATVVPFASRDQVPLSLLKYLSDQFAKEIEKGDTYPMIDPMPFEKFASYWFQNFGAIMLLGSIEKPEDVVEGKDWAKECLGSFYTKPNYPGRSSHICNAGFLVTDAVRNRGVGRLMGEAYLDWAPKLGYKYSVFNLVYETNVASCRIWDALGFKRIGRVPACGNLKSYPDRLVDAIIYGRELSLSSSAAAAADSDGTAADLVSEERFDKIKFYLKHARYPDGADRAEKSRLRSAALHYTLLDNDVLMLKDKEVIADAARQYEIARQVHALEQQHAGINKTTAAIAERYHWRGIKDTVSDVIRACAVCDDSPRTLGSMQQQQPAAAAVVAPNQTSISDPVPCPPGPAVLPMPGLTTMSMAGPGCSSSSQQCFTSDYVEPGGDGLAAPEPSFQLSVNQSSLQSSPGLEWATSGPQQSFTHDSTEQHMQGQQPQALPYQHSDPAAYVPSVPSFSDAQYNPAIPFNNMPMNIGIDGEDSRQQLHGNGTAFYHEEPGGSGMSDREFEMLLTEELRKDAQGKIHPY